MYSVSSIDKLTFLLLEAGDPFAHMIDADSHHQPVGLKIRRTTSNKNSWAKEIYDDNIFGGLIPENTYIPLEIEVDENLLDEKLRN